MEFGSYHRTNQTCLTHLSFRNYHTRKKTPPTPSRLPLPPTVSVLQKPSPVTAGTSGFGNHPPRAISYIARPNMPHRQTQLPNLFTRSLANNTSEEWPPLSSSRQQRQPVSLAPVILKVTDGKANFRLMDMVELKAIVQDITNQAGAPKHPETPRGGDLFIFPSDLTQQQPTDPSVPAYQNHPLEKKASSTTCLTQNQKRISSTPSSFKVQQKWNASIGPPMAQKYQQ